MRFPSLLPLTLLALGLLSGCDNDPVENRLTDEQLAWQPYRVNDVLRFGHAKDGQVRTYRVTEVKDEMEKQFVSYNFVPGPRRDVYNQHLTVVAQRTDTVAVPQTIFDMRLDEIGGSSELRTEATWESIRVVLPIGFVIVGTPLDTLQDQFRDMELLPTATFGPRTYSRVIHVAYRFPDASPSGRWPIQGHLYYVRQKGVVAFEEKGRGLWYLLP